MIRIFLSIILILSFAFAEKKTVPIIIESNHFEYFNNQKLAIYKKDVVVRKGLFILYADLMKVFFDQAGNIKKIIAEGNVRFKKGEYSGSSDKAIYEADKDLIKLIENAQVKKGNNVLEGDEIDYYLKEEKAIVIGKNKKVRTIIIPEETKK